MNWEPVWARDPRPAEDADEDVLPLRERLGRGREHAHLPGLPRASRRAAGAEPDGDRVDGQARPRARLRDRRARALPPQALLLSGPAEGLPDLPVRRAALRDGRFTLPDGRTATARSGSSARTSRRTPPRRSTSAAPAAASHGAEHSLVDFNRGGTPLVEIVTEPDIRSAEEARRFLQLLRQTVVELGISDAEMEKGSLRCDANVSVREAGGDRVPHEDRAQEHELVQVRRRRDRGRGRRDRSASTRRAARSCRRRSTTTPPPGRSRRCARRRRRTTTATSRARPRPGRAAGRAGRGPRRGPRASGRAHPPARGEKSASISPRASSRAVATALRARAGDHRAVANVIMNQFAATGVDPAR